MRLRQWKSGCCHVGLTQSWLCSYVLWGVHASYNPHMSDRAMAVTVSTSNTTAVAVATSNTTAVAVATGTLQLPIHCPTLPYFCFTFWGDTHDEATYVLQWLPLTPAESVQLGVASKYGNMGIVHTSFFLANFQWMYWGSIFAYSLCSDSHSHCTPWCLVWCLLTQLLLWCLMLT